MPPRRLRAVRIRLRQARRMLAAMGKQFLGLLLVYFALVWTLPFIFQGPYSWRLGIGRNAGFPAPDALGELMILSNGDKRIRNGYYHDFDLADALDSITDHFRRLLNAHHVSMLRVLTEEVTAPVFSESYWPRPRNKTADLMGWVQEDTDSICLIVMVETKNTISKLAEHEELCGLAVSASECPAEDAAEDASTECAEPRDVRCSAENAHNRDKLLRSFRDLEAKFSPACDEIRSVLWRATNFGSFWGRLRERVNITMNETVTELRFLHDTFVTIDLADDALHHHYWLQPNRRKHIGGVRLDGLASRAAADHPDDLDPFTAVVLCFLRETGLLALGPIIPGHLTSMPRWSWTARLSDRPVGTQSIRFELGRQAHIINATSDLLASAILPWAREWSALMRDVKRTNVLKTTSNGAGDVSHEPISFWQWLWRIDSKAAGRDEGRRLKAFDDGVEHLEFLRGYLVQLRHGLPGMVARLNLWDAEVTELDDELTTVLTWGKKYTGRRREGGERLIQSQRAHERRGGGSSGTASDSLDITRWQISPSTLGPITGGLWRLERALGESWAKFESLNPQDTCEDNWFESGMHRWSWSMLE